MKKTILLICTTLALLSIGCQKDRIINKIVIYNPNGGEGFEYAREIERRYLNCFTLESPSDMNYYKNGYEGVGWSTEDGLFLQPDIPYGPDIYDKLQDVTTLNAVWQKYIRMSNGTYHLSDGENILFFDSGGIDHNYYNNENYTYYFYAPQGKHLSVIFHEIDLESYDKLTINGDGNITTNYLYLTPGNSLCVTFKSNYSYTRRGWHANISVVD